MPSASHSPGQSTVFVVVSVALLSLLLSRKVSARVLGGSQRRRGHARGAAFSGSQFDVGLLELAFPGASEGSKLAFRRLMINDACIAAAVQGVNKSLMVSIRDTADVQPGKLRSYVSDLYCQLWDVVCLQDKVTLDVRVLLPSMSSGSPTWEQATFEPQIQAIFTDRSLGPELGRVNSQRLAADLPALAYVSLADVSAQAYNPDYFYLEDPSGEVPSFPQVACGGTFDNLHNGHKKLLTMAASVCTSILTVGVTCDAMLKNKQLKCLIAPISERIQAVEDFVRSVRPGLEARVVEITDPFGPPIHEPDYDAIVVSSETVKGGEKINEVRASKGFHPLRIIVTRRTEASTLSSTFIRRWLHERLKHA